MTESVIANPEVNDCTSIYPEGLRIYIKDPNGRHCYDGCVREKDFKFMQFERDIKMVSVHNFKWNSYC